MNTCENGALDHKFWANQKATKDCCSLITVFPSSLMEKAMASHSSTLAWKTPWTEEPGRLQSMGPLRVGHD